MNNLPKHDINLRREINPAFYPVWRSKKPYNILKGGRNSFKSSTISLRLVYDMLKYINRGERANIIILRKVATTIRDSVFIKIQWAIDKFTATDRFHSQVSPYRIVDRATGSTFYFYGQDDFEKLKSSAVGNIIAVWYEEASEFRDPEEFDQTNITFMRQNHPLADFVQFFWSYNPPRNQYSWINEWSTRMEAEPDYLVHTSTYQDDRLGFVTPQMMADIERVKANDPDYYRYLYLGIPVGLGTDVYNFDLFHKIDKLPEGEYIRTISFGLDTGHQQSATACVCVGITNRKNVVVMETYYYSPAGKKRKLAPDELSSELFHFTEGMSQKYGRSIYKRTIDSAEGAIRNQYYKDYGIRWNPINKSKKVTMIDYVVTLLAQGRVFYFNHPANDIFVSELKTYRWDERSVYSDNPRVIDENDHTCDAFQYFVNDNLVELGLVW